MCEFERQSLVRCWRGSASWPGAIVYASPEVGFVDLQLVSQDMAPQLLSVGGSIGRVRYASPKYVA